MVKGWTEDENIVGETEATASPSKPINVGHGWGAVERYSHLLRSIQMSCCRVQISTRKHLYTTTTRWIRERVNTAHFLVLNRAPGVLISREIKPRNTSVVELYQFRFLRDHSLLASPPRCYKVPPARDTDISTYQRTASFSSRLFLIVRQRFNLLCASSNGTALWLPPFADIMSDDERNQPPAVLEPPPGAAYYETLPLAGVKRERAEDSDDVS